MLYSLIIPVFNEAESLAEIHREITVTMEKISGGYEIIFVDDGSYDESPQCLRNLEEKDPRVKCLTLSSHSGKAAAYSAGFNEALGSTIITLDADLQDDPKEIPRLLPLLQNGFDLVIGRKKDRLGNEPYKTIASRVFNLLVRILFKLNIYDSNSGFRVMRRCVAGSLDLYGDLYRFIPQMANIKGYRVTEIEVQHRKRKYGHSKYTAVRFWTSVMDLLTVRFLTAFIYKPLHFFGTLGLIPIIIGVGLEVYVLIRKLLGEGFSIHLAALTIGVLLIIVGIQLIATGLIGEMLIAQGSRRKYSLRKIAEKELGTDA